MEGLNRGLPKLGIGKSSKVNRLRAEQENKLCFCRTSKVDSVHSKDCGTENDCADIDKKCLCRGILSKVEGNVDLNSTRELLKKLDL